MTAEADFTGSTSGIIDWIDRERPSKGLSVTECSIISNITDAFPDVAFQKPCNMCPYMKMISLEKMLWSLHTLSPRWSSPRRLRCRRIAQWSG